MFDTCRTLGGSWVALAAVLALLAILAAVRPAHAQDPTVTDLAATANGPTQIDLSWTAVTIPPPLSIVGYGIQVSLTGTDNSWTTLVANTGSTAAAYSHIGLTAGATRYYRIYELHHSGGSAEVTSNVASATTVTTAPGTPTGLTATANGQTQIDLSWTAPSETGGSTLTGYKIEASPTGTDGTWKTLVADTGSAATKYSHTGLTAATTRHYQVSAINAVGTSDPSTAASATTDPLKAPTGLTAKASGQTRIELTWTAPAVKAGDVTGYKIEVSPSGADGTWTTQEADTGSTATGYIHTSLTAGTTRYYQVSAIGPGGTSGPSTTASATTAAAGAPGAPTSLTATASGQYRIDLSWTAPSGDAPTGYKIEVSPSGTAGTWTPLEFNTGSTATTYSDTSLAPGTTRHYRVSAVNAAGTGDPSNEASTTTSSAGSVRVEPLGGALKVSWNREPNYASASVRWKIFGVAGEETAQTTSTTYTITNLTPGTNYLVEVTLRFTPGRSPKILPFLIARPLLGKVTGVTAAGASQTSLQIGWDAASGAQSYAVQWKSGAQDWSEERHATASGTSHTITSLEAGTTYTVRVQARRSGLSPGDWSEEASATTPNLTATLVLNTSATLNVTGHPVTWYYKHTTPSGGTCSAAQSGSSADVTGLTPGEDYTFATYSDGLCTTMLASVSFMTTEPTATATSVSGTGATLNVTEHPGTWYYQQTVPSGEDCSAAQMSTTADVAGLMAGKDYTFETYSDSSCMTMLASVSFTTPGVTTSANSATEATLKVAGHPDTWYYKQTVPSGPSCSSAQMETTADVTGLTAGTDYTFETYSDSSCTSMLASVSFTAAARISTTLSVSVPEAWPALDNCPRRVKVGVTFSAPVTGFGHGGVTASAGTIVYGGSFGADVYAFDLTLPEEKSGTVTVSVADNAATGGEVGNLGASEDIVYSCPRPETEIQVIDTNNTPVTYLANGEAAVVSVFFSKDVTGFATGELTASAGTLGGITSGSQALYSASLTAPQSGSGDIRLNVAANVATATGGHGNFAAPEVLLPYGPPLPALAASEVRDTTATLTLANHAAAWWHMKTVPATPAGTCAPVQAGTVTVQLTGLAASTAHTWKAYSDATCMTEIASEDFSTVAPLPRLEATVLTHTTATLTVANHVAEWRHMQTDPAGGTCAPVLAGTTTDGLTGLMPGTDYTWTMYSASCADADKLDSVTFSTPDAPGAMAGSFTRDGGATLTVTGYHPATWHYRQTAPSGPTCSSAQMATSAALTGLTSGTSYTYETYSDSACAMKLADVSFEFKPNAAPTGVPTISGTVGVGATLSASRSGIRDADGLGSPGWTWQWIRVDGNGTETNINGATAETYTVTAADVGSMLKVKVAFTDDEGNAEMLTSAATAEVPAPPPVLRASSVSRTGATLTVEHHPSPWHYKQTAPSVSGCLGPQSGTSVTLDGLEAATNYSYETHSNSSCTMRLQGVSFRTAGGGGGGGGGGVANSAPAFATEAVAQRAVAGTPFSYMVPAATDPEEGEISYAASLADGGTLPGWLAFNTFTRTFSGTPLAADAPAELSVTVTARDDGIPPMSVTTTFTLTVAEEGNAPPAFATGAVAQTAAEDEAFSYTVPAATDPEDGVLTYAATLADGGALPGWLAFNAATRTFSGTPGEADAPAEHSVTVTATDDGNPPMSATTTFTLTVEEVNHPPAFATPAAAQTTVAGEAFSYTVPAATDPEDGVLTYRATLADGGALPGWLAFYAATRTLSGTPGEADASAGLSITVTATDDGNPPMSAMTTFTLTVEADPRTALLKGAVRKTLASVARRSLTSALDNIGARFAASAPTSGMTLAGKTVLQPFAGPAEGEGGCGAEGPDDVGHEGCGAVRTVTEAELLDGSAFSMDLGEPGADRAAVRWAVWGRGDLGTFEGRPEPGSHHRGELRTGWLGVDARAGPWVAGLAVSHARGEADYVADAEPDGSGRLETEVTALHPYGRWTFPDGLELRGVLGAGTGEVRHAPDGGAERETSGLRMYMGSVGFRRDLPPAGGLDLAVQGDASVSRLETDPGPQRIDGLGADSWRVRLGLEASRPIALEGGGILTPFAEAALRRDGGDGIIGTGVEMAGGVRYAAPGVLVEARGRWLAVHSEAGARESGVSLTARVGPGAHGRGLSLALTPRWGADSRAAALWREEMPEPGDGGGASVDARVGYGITLAARGLLTPFAEARAADGSDRLRVGTRFEARHADLGAEISGERSERADGAANALSLRFDLRF